MSGPKSIEPTKLSRGEVETLCVLHTIGVEGCRVGELASRLGLSASLAAPIAQGMEPLVATGLLTNEEGRFTVTDTGQALLRTRLAELGVG